MRDSYTRFFSELPITKEQFFGFGLQETIYAPLEVAKESWEELKKQIQSNRPVYMRGFGRNSNRSHLYQEFYKHVMSNENVQIDKTNNNVPTKVIRDLTGYSKSKHASYKLIRNYQVSHIFGRTKNIFAFTAAWNIVYLPKIIDPFTGHEAKNELVDEYQHLFQQKSYTRFESLIENYNQLMMDKVFQDKVDTYLAKMSHSERNSQSDIDKLVKSVRGELSPIIVPHT